MENEGDLDTTGSHGGIRSVERAAAVVEEISDAGRRGCRLVDIVTRTGLTKTTVHRVLNTLVKVGWVECEQETGTYFLGPSMIGYGITASNRHGLLNLAAPHLRRIADLTDDTVFLSVRAGRRALCADQASGNFPIRVLDPAVGDHRPLGSCAGSLALLAWLPDDEVEQVMTEERTRDRDHRLPDSSILATLISEAREQGYTVYPGLLIPDSLAVGVPVRGHGGEVVAALSVASIHSRMDEVRRSHIVQWLQCEADALSESLLRLNPEFGSRDISRTLIR